MLKRRCTGMLLQVKELPSVLSERSAARTSALVLPTTSPPFSLPSSDTQPAQSEAEKHGFDKAILRVVTAPWQSVILLGKVPSCHRLVFPMEGVISRFLVFGSAGCNHAFDTCVDRTARAQIMGNQSIWGACVAFPTAGAWLARRCDGSAHNRFRDCARARNLASCEEVIQVPKDLRHFQYHRQTQ